MAKANILTRAKKTKANEFALQGRLQEACELYLKVCRTDPSDAEAWTKASDIYRQLGDLHLAVKYARHAIMLQPKYEMAQFALGLALHAQNHFDEAAHSYRQAIALQPQNADTHYRLGNALLRGGGAPNDAAESYRKAIQLQPDFVDALSNLASVLGGMGNIDEAAALIQRVVHLRPNSAGLLCDMGNVMQVGGRIDEAEALFLKALKVEPTSIKTLGSLARLWEKTGRLPEAKDISERGLRMKPDDPILSLAAAKIARREGRTQDGIDLLEPLLAHDLAPEDAAAVRILLGQFYDRIGDSAHAYPLFAEGKQFSAKAAMRTDEIRERYFQKSLASLGRFTKEEFPTQVLATEVAEYTHPIFMIGFPRSGTTLLEQILDSHPDLQTLEEKGTVAAMLTAFLTMTGERENALAELDQMQITQLRKIYFDEADRHLSRRPGAQLVDKMPLNTAYVPLIWRVFPHAKFILSIRHPCDVCLSCFMQNFAVNEGMAGFFTLEDTATVYSLVMGAWQKYARVLPLNYCKVRYEDLIQDVEGEARRLLDFIGVAWDDAVLNHTEHAQRRANIQTPSYHQVTQPIYQRAKYRWKRYEKEFEPVMASLQPFIESFGYSE